MHHHVYARLAGYHLTVIPQAPFRIQRTEGDAQAIDVEYFAPNGTLFAHLIPHEGGYKSKLDQHTKSLYDVLDVEAGPELADWQIETSLFTCDWPHGYALCSTNFPDNPVPFNLFGQDNETIFVQSPQNVPTLKEMFAAGQYQHMEHEVRRNFLDTEFKHQGEVWLQRLEIVWLLKQPFVVTMQAPISLVESVTAAALQLAASIR